MPQRRSPLPRLGELFVAAAAVLCLLAASVSAASSLQPEQVTVLAQAHAHNDYENSRPLQDALERGYTSVEADVWLMGGELFVAHDRNEVTPGSTLETLYLEPLARQVRHNGGRVHRDWPHPLQLLVDVKSEAGPTYAALERLLRRYDEMLTRFTSRGVRTRAVTVTVSGNRDVRRPAGRQVRYAAYDGRLEDLGSGASRELVPLISADWTETFTWRGQGPMPEADRRRLDEIVAQAHGQGRRVRFWGTSDLSAPARRNIWDAALAAGVDHLESDGLNELRDVILAADPSPSAHVSTDAAPPTTFVPREVGVGR